MRRSRGFTLVELLVVVGIIALLVTILMPTLQRARELAKQSVCMANLNGIGKGLLIYTTEFNRFPLLSEYGNSGQRLYPAGPNATHADNVWATNSSGDLVLGANAMQNLWLIIKDGTSENFFRCPTDGQWLERQAPDLKKFGWVRRENFSYGLHKPYDNDEDSLGENKAPLTSEPVGGFVIMTDKGDGISVYRDDAGYHKPLIHKDDGFACLDYGCSVKFHQSKVETKQANSDAGIGGDDVYIAGDEDGEHVVTIDDDPQTADENPTDDTDTFIVPWEYNDR
jgi:prepilin-type N-terminal cleavage/methylation domain-containing protein